ncbi:Hypothetical protein (Fragment) [Durusdinium trenchii]|uniref:Uncharacterized protein n=1 Tax=Durusdinium trenchii TaxID=1381693 RepID=A0ABP0QBA4_9DINO
MDTGTYTIESSIGAVTLAASRSTRSVKGWGTGADVSFGASLGASPLVISSQNSRFGADGGWARITAVWKGRAHVEIDEDQACDKERTHPAERVSLFGASGPCVF